MHRYASDIQSLISLLERKHMSISFQTCFGAQAVREDISLVPSRLVRVEEVRVSNLKKGGGREER